MRHAALVVAFLLSLCAPALAQPDPFHPLNLLLTQQRIDEVQRGVATDPVLKAARDRLYAEAQGYLTRTPDPIQGVLRIPGYYTKQRALQQQITRQLRGDAYAARCLALAWAFGAGPDYARKAKEFLFAWVQNLTRPADGPRAFLLPWGDTPLVISYSFPHFCYAFDVLEGTGQLSAAEGASFRAWLRPFVDYLRRPEPVLNNHYDWRLLFLLAGAHVLRDKPLFQQAVDEYRRVQPRQIGGSGAMWRELLRGKKAATYSLMALEAKVQAVVIAEAHGAAGLRDLGASGSRAGYLRRAIDHLLGFVKKPSSWRRHFLLTWHWNLNGPSAPDAWGWIFELPAAWWGDASYLAARGGPRGLNPERAYTLSYPVLLFRAVATPVTTPTTTGVTGALGGSVP
ncbi:MAG: alginate lyase family protein [Planctomycetota bacterium]